MSTQSDKPRRGSRAEINRRALHNARRKRERPREGGGKEEGKRAMGRVGRRRTKTRAVERGACPFPRVCIAHLVRG